MQAPSTIVPDTFLIHLQTFLVAETANFCEHDPAPELCGPFQRVHAQTQLSFHVSRTNIG